MSLGRRSVGPALRSGAWSAMSWPARVLAIPVYAYRWLISPLLPRSCRYQPTCSSFALEALARHGPLIGVWLTFRRMSRCHPFESLGGGEGYDPVPEPSAVRRPGLRALWEMGRRHEDRVSGRRGDHG